MQTVANQPKLKRCVMLLHDDPTYFDEAGLDIRQDLEQQGVQIIRAVYDPRQNAPLPDGTLHFASVKDAASYAVDNRIDAIVSGMRYVPRIRISGPRQIEDYGPALARELHDRGIPVLLMSKNPTHEKVQSAMNVGALGGLHTDKHIVTSLLGSLTGPTKPHTVVTDVVRAPRTRVIGVNLSMTNERGDPIAAPTDVQVTQMFYGDHPHDNRKNLMELNGLQGLKGFLEHFTKDAKGDAYYKGVMVGVNPGVSDEDAYQIAEYCRQQQLRVTFVDGHANGKGLSFATKAACEEAGANVIERRQLPAELLDMHQPLQYFHQHG